ncbi:hypothetical protein PENFLA_c015G02639 [Penicillium flavigenum]|uniref:Lysine-specific metallo-endopeptidase domain-containing protein n=1 Tax=Penicillium flavigenum TaxID=254877 RepID=A0A1V6T4J2_9EURO|nr:hypothetical protein PENFLA_c015G02639 [Penicillium flavigenum]
MVSTQVCMRYALLVLVACLALAITAVSQNVNTRFRIEQGTGAITRTGNMGGSCEDIDMDLDAVYREAIDMARVAVAAMDGYTSDATVRASLFTFFGIQEDESTHTVSAGSAARFSRVKANLQEVIDDSQRQFSGLFPSLFCSEKWRWRTRYFHNRQTGKPTGQLLKSVNPDIEWLTWSPRFREYGPATVMCQGDTMAFTTSQDRKLSITLCPRYFSYPRRKDTLQPWRSGQRTIAAGTNMAVALSSPATFLHELMHMTTRSNGVTKKAYGPVLTGYLAQVEGGQKTVTNADNYGWFATAMYLNGVDWSRIIAGKRISGPLTRRSVLLEDGHGSWRTFLRGKAGNETIDTDGMDMDGDDCSTSPWDE